MALNILWEWICIYLYRVFIKYCVFSEDFKIFRTLAFPCLPSVSVRVYIHQAGRTPALQQNWQSSEKSQNLKEKIQYLMNTLFFTEMSFWSYLVWSYESAFNNKLRHVAILNIHMYYLRRVDRRRRNSGGKSHITLYSVFKIFRFLRRSDWYSAVRRRLAASQLNDGTNGLIKNTDFHKSLPPLCWNLYFFFSK